ncbi:MAG: VCBS repeat-containing protein [Thiotrichaceae bacterium]|nr:VCBS repeat-containing protein [Thiotrichaceae bacterium]
MLTKTLKMSSLLLAMFPLTSQAQAVESCLGESYSYREAPPEITPPTIKILGQTLPQLKAGETLRLKAEIVAQGQTNLVWCTPTGQLLKNSDDLRAVIYRAPDIITEDRVVAIGAQADDNGYVGGDTIFVYLRKSVAGETLILVGTSQNPQLAYTPDGKAFTGQVAASTGNITVDVNGDGTPDVIIGLKTADEITINGSPLKVFGSATNSSSTTTSSSTSSNNQGKTAICHKGKNTLYLPAPAIKAHLKHGDTLGECAQSSPTTTGGTTPNVVHGVNVGVGDLDGDGVPEIVVAMASAGSRIEVYTDNQLLTEFDAFSGNNGLLIAVGDINGDGIAEIIVAEVNGKEVRIFDSEGVQQGSFSTTESITSLAIGKGNVSTQASTGSTDSAVLPKPVISAPDCPTSTTLSFSCAGQNRTIENANIEKDVSVSGLTLKGNAISAGMISNSTVAEGAVLTGGSLTGYIINQGTTRDITFVGGQFSGGIVGGNITNASKVGGVVRDIRLEANAHLSGGNVDGMVIGDITGTSVLSNLTIRAGSIVINVQLGENVIIEKGATVIVSPSVLPLQETNATDAQGKSITTKTRIAAGIKVNKEDFKSHVAHKQSVPVEISMRTAPDATHVGKNADMIVYATYQKTADSEPILFSVLDDKGTVREWDGKPASLLAFRKNIQLETINELPLFKGNFSAKGHLQVFVGYRLETGESFITKLPLTTVIE